MNIKIKILIIITIIVLFYYCYINYIKSKQKHNVNIDFYNVLNKNKNININQLKLYYNGKYKLNNPIQNALSRLNIITTNKLNDVNIYFPCSFNFVEVELNKICFSRLNDKYYFENKVIIGIPGCDKLCSKNAIWNNLKTIYGFDNASYIMPKTYLINNKYDINLVKENSRFNNSKIYILKNNNQGKKGLYLTNNINILLNNKSRLREYNVIQKYITNPYLINKRKLNIRLYVILINKYSSYTKWYLYSKGKCIYNNKDYNIPEVLNSKNLKDLEQHFTSVNLDYNYVYKKLNNPETLEQLKLYLGNKKYNNLIYKIILKLKKIKHCYNSLHLLKNTETLLKNICVQYFGVDIILDEVMEPYILEFNKGPNMQYNSPNDKDLKNGLMLDIFTIIKMLYFTNNIDNNNDKIFIKNDINDKIFIKI